jgi:hypothetical protein
MAGTVAPPLGRDASTGPTLVLRYSDEVLYERFSLLNRILLGVNIEPVNLYEYSSYPELERLKLAAV